MQIERLELVAYADVVDLADAKEHLIVGHDDDDDVILRCLIAATTYAETHTGRTFLMRKIRAFDSCWPASGLLDLPTGPVRRIDAVEYVDTAGDTITVSTDDWHYAPHNGGHRLQFHKHMPSTNRHRMDGVSVTYLAGYGPLPDAESADYDFDYPMEYGAGSGEYDAVPETQRHAIRMLTAHWYENREAAVVGTIAGQVPIGALDLLHQERTFGV